MAVGRGGVRPCATGQRDRRFYFYFYLKRETGADVPVPPCGAITFVLLASLNFFTTFLARRLGFFKLRVLVDRFRDSVRCRIERF